MAIELNKNEEGQAVSSPKVENGNEGTTIEKQAMFSHAFSFSGRIRRFEFGLSYIIYSVLAVVLSVGAEESPWLAFFYIPLLWFTWAQMCKRFHDKGESGLRIFTLLIPLYNIYVLIMLFFEDGEPYENDYGKDPKGRDMYA